MLGLPAASQNLGPDGHRIRHPVEDWQGGDGQHLVGKGLLVRGISLEVIHRPLEERIERLGLLLWMSHERLLLLPPREQPWPGCVELTR